MKPIKRTPDNHPYLAAAVFFLLLLVTGVIFYLVITTVQNNDDGGLGDTEGGVGVFGSGTGDGVGGAAGDAAGEKGRDSQTVKGASQTPGNKPIDKSAEQDAPEEKKKSSQQQEGETEDLPSNQPSVKLYVPDSAEQVDRDDDEDAEQSGKPAKFASGGKSVFKVKKNESVLFIVDISGSMFSPTAEGLSRLEVLKIQLKATILSMHKKKSIGKYGIIVFSSDNTYYPTGKKKQFSFRNAAELKKTEIWIDDWRHSLSSYIGGGTALYPALQRAVNMINSREIQVDSIYLLTDGEPGDGMSVQAYINLLKQLPKKIRVNTISIGHKSQLLNDIANACRGKNSEFK